jgi:predicted kinase
MLLVFAGLPGTGKTTLSRELARELGAVHVRIDTIEWALREALPRDQPIDDLGYRVAYAVAEDNLRLGRMVVADSVNPLTITREAWHGVAGRAGVPFIDVEIVCSDRAEHRRRVESRAPDIAGHKLPSWSEVVAREYHAWTSPRIVVDTAGESSAQAFSAVRSAVAAAMSSA